MSAQSAPREQPSALLTDLYQLSMLDAYYRLGMEQTAIFEFFVGRLLVPRFGQKSPSGLPWERKHGHR